jgi:hypothetical protein
MESLAILVIVILGGVGGFIWLQSKAKGRWGIGPLTGLTCPRCGTKLPMIRKPTSAQQMLWGGWTCPQCGCKVDKYGREIASS